MAYLQNIITLLNMKALLSLQPLLRNVGKGEGYDN